MKNRVLIVLRLISPTGARRGKEVYFSKQQILIGRSEDCDVRPACFEVSRRHCQINVKEDGFWVQDLNSANGTNVRGKPVVGTQKVEQGDVIQIGSLHVEVQIPESVEPPDPTQMDEGGILRWINEFAETNVQSASQTLYGQEENYDFHEMGVTKCIGNDIDSYLSRFPQVSTDQIRTVLRQLYDALDETPDGYTPDHIPPRLVDSWPRISEDTRQAVMAIVDSAITRLSSLRQ
ncbi:MAG: FHA domain-containing protein [Planctomycetales bacterium]